MLSDFHCCIGLCVLVARLFEPTQLFGSISLLASKASVSAHGCRTVKFSRPRNHGIFWWQNNINWRVCFWVGHIREAGTIRINVCTRRYTNDFIRYFWVHYSHEAGEEDETDQSRKQDDKKHVKWRHRGFVCSWTTNNNNNKTAFRPTHKNQTTCVTMTRRKTITFNTLSWKLFTTE